MDVRWVFFLFFFLVAFSSVFLLEEKFTAPSVLHAVDRLGREAVVTTGSTHGRVREGEREAEREGGERLTFKGQAESAGRKRPFNRAGIQKTAIYKVVIITEQKVGECRWKEHQHAWISIPRAAGPGFSACREEEGGGGGREGGGGVGG